MSSSFDEALSEVLALASSHGRTPSQRININDAVDRVASVDIFARRCLPAFDNSAMDGICVSSSYCSSSSPDSHIDLRVMGSIAAGDVPLTFDHDVEEDMCWEIMTGAPFPLPKSPQAAASRKLDACVRIEHVEITEGTRHKPSRVRLTRPVRPDQERRLAGEDYAVGDLVISSGTVIEPQHVLALASLGISHIDVAKRILVAIITTGKELEPVTDASALPSSEEASTPQATVFNSNGPYLRVALSTWGCDVLSVNSVGDAPDDFSHAVRAAMAAGADAIMTTGGVSKGKHDYVRPVLRELGAHMAVEGVRMRPGRPVCVAELQHPEDKRAIVLFALPGNPSAAALCARVLAEPYFRSRIGRVAEEGMYARLHSAASHHSAALSCSITIPNPYPESTVLVSAMPTRRFIPASLLWTKNGPELVLRRAAGGLVSGFAGADVWMEAKEDEEIVKGAWVRCLPT
jgi:molybdopterin molybdotransferase